MPILYNCRHAGDQYRITKFDDDMNVQSSYLCTIDECDCPAGSRNICRHRQMLHKFIGREHIGDEWFFDFDRGGWVQMGPEWAKPKDEGISQNATSTFIYTTDEPPLPITDISLRVDAPQQGEPTGLQEEQILMGFHQPELTQQDWPSRIIPLPEGVTVIVMDHPDDVVKVNNAIAEALGEPEAALKPPAPKHIPRRL